MDTFEPKVTQELIIPETIKTNIEDLDTVIAEKEELSRSLVVTDDLTQVEAADKDATEITKMVKTLSRFRIDFIEKWKSPIKQFETTCKQYEKRLEAAAAALREKTAEVKAGWREKRCAKMLETWKTKVGEAFSPDIQSSPHFIEFFNHWTAATTIGNWLNKSMTDAKVESAMDAEVERIKTVIEAITETYSGESAEVKAKANLALISHFDSNEVMQTVNKWKREQAELAERKEKIAREEAERREREEAERRAREEEERRADEVERMKRDEARREDAERKPSAAPAASAPTPETQHTPSAPRAEIAPEDPVFRLSITITAKRSQLVALRKFIADNNITYRKNYDPVRV